MNQVNRGTRLEDCLANYPEHAVELEPLLRTMLDTRSAVTFTPSPETKRLARQRFNAALETLEKKREEKRPLFPKLLGWSGAWATAAAVLVLILVGYFGLKPALAPVGPGLQPGTEGYFTFLISDEVNAIGDFQNLEVSISKIGLHLAGEDGEDGQWIELDPQEETADLTVLQGTRAQQIWSGNVTAGRYTRVFIHVSSIQGILNDDNGGQEAEVKLPSNRLQISIPFEVTSEQETNFVYDLTVVAAGNEVSGIKYILKPQIAESGADKDFEKITRGNKPDNPGAQGAAVKSNKSGRPDGPGNTQNALQLQLEGDPAPGAEISLLVSDEDTPLSGATVYVNGEIAGNTDANGRLVLMLPDMTGAVEIMAAAGDKSGELKIVLRPQQQQQPQH
jgi:hypothetical protein